MSKRLIFMACALTALLTPTAAHVHPHVFAMAKMNLVIDANGNLEKIAHRWMFDELFSSAVLVEFDMNRDLKLDLEELAGVQVKIENSIGEFNYFQIIQDNGREIKMSRPPNLTAMMDERTLIISFDSRPQTAVALRGNLVFGAYDPTSYTAIDFNNDGDLNASALPAGCASKVVRPIPEVGLEEYKASLADPAYASGGQVNMGVFVATRLEVTCPK